MKRPMPVVLKRCGRPVGDNSRRVRPTFVMIAALLLPSATAAQEYTNLRGQIVDAETGQPITAVAVQVVGRADVAETGADGSFVLEGVLVDQMTLHIQRLGYFPLRVDLRLEGGGEPVVALQEALPMRPVPIELSELIVEVQDPWLEQPFQAKSFYRRERLFDRSEISRTPNMMPAMLSNLARGVPAGCEFDFYVDGTQVQPFAIESVVMSRAPIEFESAEVYVSNARMGQRASPTSSAFSEGSPPTPTSGRDLAGMQCGVFRLWSLGHRQLGERQYVGPMDEAPLGPLAEGKGEVRGQIISPAGVGVSGILMTVVDEIGAPAAAAVTDSQGRYVVRVSAPATYVLVAIRPGQPEWTSAEFLLEGGQVIDITPGVPVG